MTKPKYREPVEATVAGLPSSCNVRSVSRASVPCSGMGSSNPFSAARAAGSAPTRRSSIEVT